MSNSDRQHLAENGLLGEVTDRVIARGIEADNSEVEIRPQTAALTAGSMANGGQAFELG